MVVEKTEDICICGCLALLRPACKDLTVTDLSSVKLSGPVLTHFGDPGAKLKGHMSFTITPVII